MKIRRMTSDSDDSTTICTINVMPGPIAPSSSLTTSALSKRTSKKRIRRQCSYPDCSKVDAGGGLCVAHGGGRKCSFPGCMKGYQTGGYCRRHGGGARCQVLGCGKVDAGRGMCRAHGGGKRCQIASCAKADVGGGFCTFHGGGKRCLEPGCTKIDQGGGKCRAHGGARRCHRRNCQQPARGATGFCTEHGGLRVCSVMSCRRLVRSPNDTGIMCAMCSRSQKQTGAKLTQMKPVKIHTKLDHSTNSPQNSVATKSMRTSKLAPLPPLSTTSANTCCDGSHVANCLENGCARSFGGNCNCVADCTCSSATPLTPSRMAPMVASSNTDTSVVSSSSCQRLCSMDRDVKLLPQISGASLPRAAAISRVVLRIQSYSKSIGVEVIVAILATMSEIRSVHLVPDSSVLSFSTELDSNSRKAAPADSLEVASSLQLVIVLGDKLLDTSSFLTPLNDLNVAEISIIEETSVAWTRKEVVLRVPDMMCPRNCGSPVLNAVRVVEGVEAARLRFEHRQVVVRGDMSVAALCAAVQDVGFDSKVDAETLLPRRFRFRVDDLSDVGLNGVKLKEALTAVEGVENIVLLTDRVEVLVIAMMLDPSPLIEAANRVGFEMRELSEEAWGIPVEKMSPPPVSSAHEEVNATRDQQDHKCNMRVCPQVDCARYMTNVAHTAALAVGWAVPGCGMYSGGECTCGDSCKCAGCPEHNPVS